MPDAGLMLIHESVLAAAPLPDVIIKIFAFVLSDKLMVLVETCSSPLYSIIFVNSLHPSAAVYAAFEPGGT